MLSQDLDYIDSAEFKDIMDEICWVERLLGRRASSENVLEEEAQILFKRVIMLHTVWSASHQCGPSAATTGGKRAERRTS
jgi:hypothetical protein